MERYGKTPGPFKRAKSNKIIPGKWSDSTFHYLQDAKFLFTEKLDGTNIRLIYHPAHYTADIADHPVAIDPNARGLEAMTGSQLVPARLEIKGRSDAAVVHHRLVEWAETLDIEKFVNAFSDNRVCIYGEGIGDGIQKGGPQYGATHFRAFAIKGSRGFLPWYITDEICRRSLQLLTAPVILEATLNEGIEYMRTGFKTMLGPNPGQFFAEGLIGLPTVPLYRPHGERIIVKLKHQDLYGGTDDTSTD